MADHRDVRAGVHAYAPDPHACWCGNPRESWRHPHRFLPADQDPERCVCGGGLLAAAHERREPA